MSEVDDDRLGEERLDDLADFLLNLVDPTKASSNTKNELKRLLVEVLSVPDYYWWVRRGR